MSGYLTGHPLPPNIASHTTSRHSSLPLFLLAHIFKEKTAKLERQLVRAQKTAKLERQPVRAHKTRKDSSRETKQGRRVEGQEEGVLQVSHETDINSETLKLEPEEIPPIPTQRNTFKQE